MTSVMQWDNKQNDSMDVAPIQMKWTKILWRQKVAYQHDDSVLWMSAK